MVQFCCIVGCGNRSNREAKHFYRLPNIPKTCDKTSYKADILLRRRKQWLLNINRLDLKDGDAAYSPGYIRVCSDHFVSGQPSVWSDVDNVDWAPTVNLGYENGRRRRKRGPDAKVHRMRGRVKAKTALDRAMRVEDLKQELITMLMQMRDTPSVEGVTVNPTIHKITMSCIVKEDAGGNESNFDTEETASIDSSEQNNAAVIDTQ